MKAVVSSADSDVRFARERHDVIMDLSLFPASRWNTTLITIAVLNHPTIYQTLEVHHEEEKT
jgi:hypothetical protein